MPLDALCLNGLIEELSTEICGARIDKIHQPARDEVVIALRGTSVSARLLLSANPGRPRVQLTRISRENPDKPPMFCMLLRKHLAGGRITAMNQTHLERVVHIHIETLDELGDRTERTLVLEAIGRHSNLILLDAEGRIVDALRRVDNDMSAQRQVLPGLFYHLPPAQEKNDPTAQNRTALEQLICEAPEHFPVDRWLIDTFSGLSPLICRELAFCAGGSCDVRFEQLGEQGKKRLLDEMESMIQSVSEHKFVPTMLEQDGKPKDFSFRPIKQYEDSMTCTTFPDFSTLLDHFYQTRESAERMRQKGQDLIRTVTAARDRTVRKLGNQQKDLEATQDRERLRQFGDIITANLHCMERGMQTLCTANFYDENNADIVIALNELLTPQQNAARYYKEYNKAKTANEVLARQILIGQQELEYLNSVLESLNLAEGERDLLEIRNELSETGYLKKSRNTKQKKTIKKAAGQPIEFRSSSGLRISVGKNNTQNDLLTTKMAFKSDIWFHTQRIHGSHVILWTEGTEPDVQSLTEAAMLAAWFSQARESGNVPVDYTPVKYVKKPAGARPGMVIYTTYETAYVTPNEALVQALRTTKN